MSRIVEGRQNVVVSGRGIIERGYRAWESIYLRSLRSDVNEIFSALPDLQRETTDSVHKEAIIQTLFTEMTQGRDWDRLTSSNTPLPYLDFEPVPLRYRKAFTVPVKRYDITFINNRGSRLDLYSSPRGGSNLNFSDLEEYALISGSKTDQFTEVKIGEESDGRVWHSPVRPLSFPDLFIQFREQATDRLRAFAVIDDGLYSVLPLRHLYSDLVVEKTPRSEAFRIAGFADIALRNHRKIQQQG